MVTIDRQNFYTYDEIQSILNTGDIEAKNQWEVYELSYNAGFSIGWNLHRMMVNKHTGAVTGVLGANSMNGSTNKTLTTNANIALHPYMEISHVGSQVYTTTTTSADDSTKLAAINFNYRIDTSGNIIGQGISDTMRSQLATHIENFFYIGSKYGKITEEDFKPTYLPEGTFYNQNSVDLITGKAWLKYRVPLDSNAYTEDSTFIFFKNIWSGEVILQYDLYPAKANTWPTISFPTRFMPQGDLPIFLDIRFTSPYSSDVQGRGHTFSYLQNGVMHFAEIPTGTARVTSSNFYVGKTENAIGTGSETNRGHWNKDANVQVPSAENALFNTCRNFQNGYVDISSLLEEGYRIREGFYAYVLQSRTGMVSMYLDIHINNDEIPSLILKDFTQSWRPSHKYKASEVASTTAQAVYFCSPTYLGVVSDATVDHNLFTANICMHTNITVGGDDSPYKHLRYGSTGNFAPLANNNCIWSGYYLADNT